ncbi:hypothetical protein EMCRGX_G027233 [Ephydatia muelleri]
MVRPHQTFLECSGKMVRPHQTAVEDFWLALGRCLLQEDGHVRLKISGVLWEDGRAPSDSYGGLLACSRKMVVSSTLWISEVLWEDRWSGPIRQLWRISGVLWEGLNAYNGSDGDPRVLGDIGLPGPAGAVGAQGQLALQLEGAPGAPGAADGCDVLVIMFLLSLHVSRLTSPYPCASCASSTPVCARTSCGSGIDGFTKMRHQAADSTTFQFGVGDRDTRYVQLCTYRCLWRIAGLLQEDGQVQDEGFLECSGKTVRLHQTAVEDL